MYLLLQAANDVQRQLCPSVDPSPTKRFGHMPLHYISHEAPIPIPLRLDPILPTWWACISYVVRLDLCRLQRPGMAYLSHLLDPEEAASGLTECYLEISS